MLLTIASAIGRTLCGVYGAVEMLRDDGSVKDAFAVCQLLRARETDGLQVLQAIEIVHVARKHKLDPFDLWMTYEAYTCDDLDHAVTKVLEMQALYSPGRPN